MWLLACFFPASRTPKIAGRQSDFEDGNTDIKAVTGNTDIATVTITDIDFTTKLVSGTFSFDASDDDLNTIYEIRDGVFKDITFH